MRLEQLQYFISVAKTQSVNKASLEFYTTHQSLSKAIRQLEDEMGAALFLRTPKGMILTPEGEKMLPVAEECVRKLHHLQLEISHMNRKEELEGVLKLWGTTITNNILMPSLVEDFRVIYPNVRYQIDEANTPEIMRNIALHPEQLGLVIVTHDEALRDIYQPYIGEMQLYPLQQDEYVCLASAHSPLTERKQISLDEFSTYPIATLLLETNEDHPLRLLLRHLGLPEIALTTQSPRLALEAIASGKYVGISSLRSYGESYYTDHNSFVAIPFKENLTIDIMLATNLHPTLDAIGNAFIEMVKGKAFGK